MILIMAFSLLHYPGAEECVNDIFLQEELRDFSVFHVDFECFVFS